MKWPKVKLVEICNPKQWKTISTEMLTQEGYHVYGANGIIGKYSAYTHEFPTVMITCRGATCGNVHISEPQSYINGNAMALDNLSSKVNLRFLYHYLSSYNFKSVISGSAQPQITLQGLQKIELPLPPLPIQQQIADTLDKADALRQKDQELLDKYDELAQAVFYEMFGDPRINKNAYEFIELKKLIVEKDKITYGIIQPGKEVQQGVPVIRVGDFENLKIRKTGIKKVAFEIEEKYSKSRLQGDEILIACVGSIGKIALIESNEIGYNIVRATARIRVDIKKISRIYLAHYLNLPIVQEYFLKETRTVSQPTLNISHIENTRILLPKFSKQLAFENAISYLEILKSLALKSQEKSDILFSAFCQSFFN